MLTRDTPAELILKRLGISKPKEIDLEAIAWDMGARVRYRPLDRCEARIVGSAATGPSSRLIPAVTRGGKDFQLAMNSVIGTTTEAGFCSARPTISVGLRLGL